MNGSDSIAYLMLGQTEMQGRHLCLELEALLRLRVSAKRRVNYLPTSKSGGSNFNSHLPCLLCTLYIHQLYLYNFFFWKMLFFLFLNYIAIFQYWPKRCTFNSTVSTVSKISQLPYNVQGIPIPLDNAQWTIFLTTTYNIAQVNKVIETTYLVQGYKHVDYNRAGLKLTV